MDHPRPVQAKGLDPLGNALSTPICLKFTEIGSHPAGSWNGPDVPSMLQPLQGTSPAGVLL